MGIPGLTQYDQRAVPLVQKVANFGAITASYSLVGTTFKNPVVLLIIVSTLDQTVQLSLDGINDFIPMPAGATLIIDEKSDGIVLGGFNGIYVKRIGAPGAGSLYVGGFTL